MTARKEHEPGDHKVNQEEAHDMVLGSATQKVQKDA